jgi:hypothetical protein
MSATLITTLCNAGAVPCNGESSGKGGGGGGHGWVYFGQYILIPKIHHMLPPYSLRVVRGDKNGTQSQMRQ